MRKEISNWIEQANKDLEVAEKTFKIREYYYAVFWCQQAVEKGLKAVVLDQTKDKVMGHALVQLGKEAKVQEDFISKLKKLSPQYFLARYPDASEDVPYELYDEKITKEFLDIATEVLAWINNQLK
jgi:HEPN domain-containing protein